MAEPTPEERQREHDAKTLLDNYLLREFLDTEGEQTLKKWFSATTTQERENQWYYFKALRALEARLGRISKTTKVKEHGNRRRESE